MEWVQVCTTYVVKEEGVMNKEHKVVTNVEIENGILVAKATSMHRRGRTTTDGETTWAFETPVAWEFRFPGLQVPENPDALDLLKEIVVLAVEQIKIRLNLAGLDPEAFQKPIQVNVPSWLEEVSSTSRTVSPEVKAKRQAKRKAGDAIFDLIAKALGKEPSAEEMLEFLEDPSKLRKILKG